MTKQPTGKIAIFQSKDGQIQLKVNLDRESVWLTLNQLATLFDRDKSVISRHIGNVYKEKELEKISTVAKFATAQKEGTRLIERQVEYYNLDVIISVGYRIKSLRGSQFRIWATQILRDHLLKGYTRNKKRLAELRQTLRLVGRVAGGHELDQQQATGLLKVITDYTYALDLLDQYDHQYVEIHNTSGSPRCVITYEDARKAIDALGAYYKIKGLFGNEKDDSLKGVIGAIHQTFDGNDLYPSVEEKAAHLLYFVIKDHPFSDGNKRIGAFLFLWYLDINGILYDKNGLMRIGNNALVALSLMIAESKSEEKDMMAKVIVNLINKNN